MCKHCGKTDTVRFRRGVDAIVKRHADGHMTVESGIEPAALPRQKSRSLASNEQEWGFDTLEVCDPNIGCGRILSGQVARL